MIRLSGPKLVKVELFSHHSQHGPSWRTFITEGPIIDAEISFTSLQNPTFEGIGSAAISWKQLYRLVLSFIVLKYIALTELDFYGIIEAEPYRMVRGGSQSLCCCSQSLLSRSGPGRSKVR